ncbi:hypothetical protein Francci3_3939 [Frankia casuarinae]|uniref:Uncharacterized protein n=1 Tax=Frankia casuarinae (strain DSM 45818 / CECT 9043 / HFP020203 / CcI3) TaxID=106370 RepID=Q2J603_FRACC|nr:hypothetical protein Francci3_3939 [Frankia casuarinae]
MTADLRRKIIGLPSAVPAVASRRRKRALVRRSPLRRWVAGVRPMTGARMPGARALLPAFAGDRPAAWRARPGFTKIMSFAGPSHPSGRMCGHHVVRPLVRPRGRLAQPFPSTRS